MKPVQRPLVNDTLYGRIDAMPIGPSDRELAKARMRDGERLADAVWTARVAIRSWAAHALRRLRTAIAAAT
jgi:hypothetical protein